MTALVIIAHGSRRRESNDEFLALVRKVQTVVRSTYDLVEPAFLDCVPPTLAESVTGVITKGADEVFVLPYFLNSGDHVRRDIPQLVDQLREAYPECRITTLPYLGTVEGMAELVERHVQECRQ